MESFDVFIKYLPDILIKFAASVICGGLIGIERGYRGKPIGPRTTILICFGAALYVFVSKIISDVYPQMSYDPSRIVSQIIVGVGFIGAGSIIRARGHIIGLTTAATIWVAAAVGSFIGFGYSLFAFAVTILVLITLIILRKLEDKFLDKEQTNGG